MDSSTRKKHVGSLCKRRKKTRKGGKKIVNYIEVETCLDKTTEQNGSPRPFRRGRTMGSEPGSNKEKKSKGKWGMKIMVGGGIITRGGGVKLNEKSQKVRVGRGTN